MNLRSFLGRLRYAAGVALGFYAGPGAGDDYWYDDVEPAPGSFLSGFGGVGRQTAMKLAVFHAGTWLRAKTIASMPFKVYEDLGQKGRREAPEFPLHAVIHKRPNSWSTAFQLRSFLQMCRDVTGNGYARILSGPRGFADQLIPMYPERMEVRQNSDLSLNYTYQKTDGTKKTYSQDEIYHLRGFTLDGVTGLSLLTAGATAIRYGLELQEYSHRWVRNDARPAGFIKHPAHFRDQQQRENFAENWQKAYGGMNRGKTPVLEQGMDYVALRLSNADMQVIEDKQYSVEDMCRFVDVPPHKVRHLLRMTFNNVEEANIDWVVDTVRPECVNWEQQVQRDLIDPIAELYPGKTFFAEHELDGLLRGNFLTRQQGLAQRFQNGSITINQWRRLENENPIEDPLADMPFVPVNMVPLSKAGQAVDQRTNPGRRAEDREPAAKVPANGNGHGKHLDPALLEVTE